MDLAPAAGGEVELAMAASRKPLRVLTASEAELAAHEQVLAAIQKESKGKCLWLNGEPAA